MITITDEAATHIKTFINVDGCNNSIVRFGVISNGCFGWSYELKIIESPNEEDSIILEQGITIAIAYNSTMIVKGTTIDYSKVGLTQEFIYTNPNVKHTCGCGESFTVK